MFRTVKQMNNPFVKDGYLLLNASLNKLPILCADDTAKTRCSSETIHRMACNYLAERGIACGDDWREQFAACLNDPEHAASAHALIARVANDIGEIFWILKSGKSYCERSDWSAEHWAYWANIHRFYLAGGLLHGPIGPCLTNLVRENLASRGLQGIELCQVDHPAVISLIGAAKYAAWMGKDALVFDFGHSYVKQGYVTRRNDGFVVHTCPRTRSVWTEWEYESDAAEHHAAHELSDFIQHTIIELLDTVPVTCDTAVLSVANYVQHGCVVPRGGYGKLRHVAQPYDRFLSQAITAHIGRPFTVYLIHDGTAGAYAVQDKRWEEEAFIGFGTSLSVGFPCEKMNFPFDYTVIED